MHQVIESHLELFAFITLFKKSLIVIGYIASSMNHDNIKEEIRQLKKKMFSDNRDTVKSAGNKLGKIGGKNVTDFLISLLLLENPYIRNIAALALKEISDNRALDPLLAAISKNENHDYNGTMVFALESLDCSKKLKDIFRILFYETHESKISAYAILCHQSFEFTNLDLIEIQQMWNECKLNPENCPCYENKETRAMMQDALDRFIKL